MPDGNAGSTAAARARWGAAIAIVVVAALAAATPILVLGSPDGHDIEYHLSCWLDAAQQWRAGVHWALWAQWANYGFGEPRFIFYPPLSRVLGALALRLLPAGGVVAGYIFVVLGIAGASMFALARSWLPPAHAALAAAFYAVSPYVLLTAYQRNAFAELLVQAFFPLLLRFVFRLDKGTQAIAPLALVLALIWLSDLPAAVVATYALAFTVAALAALGRSWRVAGRGTAAIGLGLALAAFFVLPAAYEQRWVNIAAAISPEFRPENWEYTWGFDAEAEWFYAILSVTVCSSIALTAVAAAGSRTWRRTHPLAWQAVLALAAVSSFMLLPIVSSPVWTHLPQLEFVEFPWRWLFVLGTCFALLAPAALVRCRPYWPALVLLVLAMSGGMASGGVTRWRRHMIPDLDARIRVAGGYEGSPQFMPPATNPDLLYRNREMPLVVAADASTMVRILHWEPERKSIETRGPMGSRLTLHLLSYPAWQATVDKHSVALAADEIGRIVVPVPPGTHRLEVSFRRTPDRWGGMVLSLAAAVMLGGIAWRSRSPQAASHYAAGKAD